MTWVTVLVRRYFTISPVGAAGSTRIRVRAVRNGIYPGTLVKVILRTDTFEAMAEDLNPEEFHW